LVNYIASGFDPARFWKITPRLFVIEMGGAELRTEIRRREIWFTAMLPNLQKPFSLEEFAKGSRDRSADVSRCLAEWDKVDAALAANRNKAA
tara:strand:- start:4033 stop:4308 length:276 start_codon:yes stop_codon:yes gene_type:complete